MLSRRRHQNTDVLYWAFTFVPMCAIVLSCVGFLVTRIQMFLEALNSEYQRRAQEEWLRRECKKPEFYANMQLHADLCDRVEAHARGNAFLAALAHLFEHTYLCGYSPCAAVLDGAIDWVAGRGVPFLLVFAVAALLLPSVFVPIYRHYLTQAADVHVSHRHSDPFGRMVDGRSYPLLKVE